MAISNKRLAQVNNAVGTANEIIELVASIVGIVLWDILFIYLAVLSFRVGSVGGGVGCIVIVLIPFIIIPPLIMLSRKRRRARAAALAARRQAQVKRNMGS